MPERFEVSVREADQRLDKLIQQRFPHLGFGQTQKLIRGGRVRVDGKRAKSADRPLSGAIITLPYQGSPETSAQDAPALKGLKIYEDEALIALNKPAGLAVQGGSQVKTHIAAMIADTDLRLVHRLDRDTSGILLLAKGGLVAKQLTRAFADQAVEKHYLALASRAEVGQEKGRLDLPLMKVLKGGEGRMVIAPEGGLPAVTEFEVLAQTQALEGAALLDLRPKTGRTHQLRVHCAQMFGGILGDSKYGDAHERSKNLCLHAWKISFDHPVSGEQLSLEAPVPDSFHAVLARFGLKIPQTWSPT